jgi:uncharacterized protein YegP (UPF0339 family)
MHFYVYPDAIREIRWRLVAGNGRTLADSGEGYKRYASALHAMSIIAGSQSINIRFAPGYRPQ